MRRGDGVRVHSVWHASALVVVATLVGFMALAPRRTAAATDAARAARPAESAPGAGGFRRATAPFAFRFPRDHGAHPDTRIEWWYTTGHLASGARRFGYELTFFRVGIDRSLESAASAWAPHTIYFAHLALTDEAGRRFRWAERIARPALGASGSDTSTWRVWVEDWSATPAGGNRTRLTAHDAEFGIDLELEPAKPPAIHGTDGVSRKGAQPGETSHYYSLPRLGTRGFVRVGRDTLAVAGTSWMDHEFGSGELGPGVSGWDWFALQLDDGSDLMLYRLRRAAGGDDPASSGTWIDARGRTRHLARDAFGVVGTARWKSARTGAVYPARWRVRVPGEGLDVEVEPVLADQELATSSAAGIVYWEGRVRVRGTRRGRPVAGEGYVELTGYAGRPPGAALGP